MPPVKEDVEEVKDEVVVEEETTEEETEEAEEESDEKDSESDLDDTEIAESKNLYRALKNPQSRVAVLEHLAKQAGIDLTVEKKSEVAEAKKDIKSILKKHVGEKYEFLADMIGPAIDEIISQNNQELNSKFTKLHTSATEDKVQSALDKLASETKGESKKFHSQMIQAMEDFRPGPNISIDKYIRGLYQQVSGSARAKTTAKQIADRINRNANDVPSRLSGKQSTKGKDTPKGPMSLRDSINSAFETIKD